MRPCSWKRVGSIKFKLEGFSLTAFLFSPLVPGLEDELAKAFTFKKVHRDAAEKTMARVLENLAEHKAMQEAAKKKQTGKKPTDDGAKKKKKKKKKKPELTFIGIHSRRTDHLAYEKERGKVALRVSYYIKAMDMFRTKFKNTVFLYISDDLEWGMEALGPRVKTGDVFFVGSGDPSESAR